MTVFNLGSINIDHFYQVPHIPAPGETVAATSYSIGLGGKGANQSVAAAQAGSVVRHIGMVGPDGGEMLTRLVEKGVDITHIGTCDVATAHANVHVDVAGENMIVIYPGANAKQSLTQLNSALETAKPGDVLLLQNETSLTVEAAGAGQAAGLFVVYSAAPFEAAAARAMIGKIDLLVLNEIESEQLAQSLGASLDALPVPHILITRGAAGATWRDQAAGEKLQVPAFRVAPIDTTGAGDCLAGYVAAGLDQGMSRAAALRLASAAAAIQVTRPGTAAAIPARAEVDAFLAASEKH